MIPSSKWFPSSLQDRVVWYANFGTQVPSVGASLGLTVAEIASIANDNSVMQFLGVTTVLVDNYQDAVRDYRRIITEGNIGDPQPAFPEDPGITLGTPVATGIFERLDGYVKRIRVSPAFTEEVGSLLGINPGSPLSPVIGSVPPKLDAIPETGNVIVVKFVKAGSDGIFLQSNIDGGGWIDQGRFVRSPATLEIPGNEGHTPSSVQLRARFIDGNTPVGVLCDIVTVQTIP